MTFTVEIPDSLVESLHLTEKEISEQALQKFVLKAYCTGLISHRKVGMLLGLNYWETESFLAANNAIQEFSVEEYESDFEAAKQLMNAEK